MEFKSPAIILGANRTASDSNYIVDVYTRQGGLMHVFAKINKRSKLRASLLSPLTVVDVILNIKPNQNIHRFKECQLRASTAAITNDPIKTSLALFLGEVVQHSIRYAECDTDLYNYLEYSIATLNELQQGKANFHLVFLIHLTRFLGFFPNVRHFSETSYFDLSIGAFVERQPSHDHFLNPQDSIAMAHLLRLNYDTMHKMTLNRSQRSVILHHIIDYFQYHVNGFGKIKSLEILEMLFQ